MEKKTGAKTNMSPVLRCRRCSSRSEVPERTWRCKIRLPGLERDAGCKKKRRVPLGIEIWEHCTMKGKYRGVKDGKKKCMEERGEETGEGTKYRILGDKRQGSGIEEHTDTEDSSTGEEGNVDQQGEKEMCHKEENNTETKIQ
ncbi:hypothetical protein E2C01_053215 [Portunus trituberculatus]|uniref:Uncharacterized protein n=1 Tax=Portunus trituberculatus TaxID=210409 RepID=A0A5B7GNK3_PORTR|nr:hypothetical protein [Portunus trituberculatus]